MSESAPASSHRRERILATPNTYQPGEDPIVWLTQFDVVSRGNNWSDTSKLDTVGVYMGGISQDWYQAHHDHWKTFEAFKVAFRAKFLTPAIKARARAAANEFRQTQHMSVEEVISTLNRYFQTAVMTDDETKKACLLASLLPNIRRVVLRGSPADYGHACQLALVEGDVEAEAATHEIHQSHQDFYMIAPFSRRPVNDSQSMVEMLTQQLQEMQANLLEVTTALNRLQSRQSRETSRQPDRRNVYSVPRSCMDPAGIPGPRSPNPYQRQGPPQAHQAVYLNLIELAQEPELDAMTRSQHRHVSSPYVKPQETTPVLLDNDEEILEDLTNLFRMDQEDTSASVQHIEPDPATEQEGFCSLKALVNINGTPLMAVIDTGAACSVITKELVEDLGLEIDIESRRPLVTADGVVHPTAGAIKELPVDVKHLHLPIQVSVFDCPGRQLILGMSWLRAYKVTVDLEKNCLWIPHETRNGKYCCVRVQDRSRSDGDQVLILEDEPPIPPDPKRAVVSPQLSIRYEDYFSEYLKMYAQDAVVQKRNGTRTCVDHRTDHPVLSPAHRYADEMVVVSRGEKEHWNDLRRLIEGLDQVRLKLILEKCLSLEAG